MSRGRFKKQAVSGQSGVYVIKGASRAGTRVSSLSNINRTLSAPTRVAGLKLGRTENAVRSKASELGVSLKPTNQSPYNRRKK